MTADEAVSGGAGAHGALAAALHRGAETDRLAIFGDGAAGEIKALVTE